MKTLYLECNMGAAGDMLLGALLELLPDRDEFLRRLNAIGLPHVEVRAKPASRCGIRGTHVTVTVQGHEEDGFRHHDHCHSTLASIRDAIEGLSVSPWVKSQAAAIYGKIARAESEVHGVTVEAVHFHEVGAWDAVTDVVGVCMALEVLRPDKILCSPVHVGSGQVRCAHGLLPVPAPATALLLRGVPIYGGNIAGELCTPTGAALLTHFAEAFVSLPAMTLRATGYGMGTKEFDAANCVRALFGETADCCDSVTELSCNLDDMTGEAVAFAAGELLAQGALDVFTIPIGMKKGRPGVMLTVLCRPEDTDAMADLILLHTTTLGVRMRECRRRILPRSVETVETPYGTIRVKKAGGKAKAEYEDAAAAARAHNVPLAEVLKHI